MQPFTGIRVLDLTHVFAGPFCTYQLGVLGAEVIKVEPISMPDMTRAEGGLQHLNEANRGVAFQMQAANKRALAIDLKSVEGKAAFAKLVSKSDVLVQNYTTHCLQELGLDYPTLAKINPQLIYCSMCGYGRTGPKADHPAYDVVIQAFSGVMASNGEPNSDPVRIGPPVIDYGTGMQAAFAISAALYGREKTGLGRYIDVAMVDAALMLMTANTAETLATGTAPKPFGNHDPKRPLYSAYPTKSGTLFIGAFTGSQVSVATELLGIDRPLGNDDMRAEIRRILAARTADEWEELFNNAHVPAARVRTLEEAIEHPQVTSRDVIQPVPQQKDEGPTRLPVAAFSYDHGGPTISAAPADHGQHSREILREIGYADADIDALEKSGIVAT